MDIPVGQDTELTPCISPAHLSAPHIKFEAETIWHPDITVNEDHVVNFAMGYFFNRFSIIVSFVTEMPRDLQSPKLQKAT